MPGRTRKAPELFVAEPASGRLEPKAKAAPAAPAAKKAKAAPAAPAAKAPPAKAKAAPAAKAKAAAKAAPSPKKKAAAPSGAALSGAASADASGVVDGGLASVDAPLALRASVHAEPASGAPLHAALSFIEPAKNSDKFYVLQCVADADDDDSYYVFSRWGRTGQPGQCQLDGPKDEAAALQSFEAKFREKTGQAWGARASFAQLPGKYALLNLALTTGPAGRWQYWVDDGVDGKPTGWYDYDAAGTEQTEELHSTWTANESMSTRFVDSGHFTYRVDLKAMEQQNTRTGTTRYIRRVAPGAKPDDEPPSSR